MKNVNPEIQKSQIQIVNKTKFIPSHRIKLPNYEEEENIINGTRKKDNLQRKNN